MNTEKVVDLASCLTINQNTVNLQSRDLLHRVLKLFNPANEALRVMNGAQLGSKQIVVRLHEPKQLRQEKLAHRFNNGHPRRSSSGATSPAASEAGESYSGWNSPHMYSPQTLGSPALSPKPVHFDRPDRGRRGSASYYTVRISCRL